MHVFVFSVFCAVSCVLSSVALKHKAPNGGYRLEAQESQNEETEHYSQHPPPLRQSEQYSTEIRIKSPLSYEIPDNTPWRPMVSESTSRIHKTSFGKEFKYHSFVDPKSSSEMNQDEGGPSAYNSVHPESHPQFIFSNPGADSGDQDENHRHHHNQNQQHFRSAHEEHPQNPYQPDPRHRTYVNNNPFSAKPEHPKEQRAPQYLQTQAADGQPEQQNTGGVRYVYVQESSDKKGVNDPQRHFASYHHALPPQYGHHAQQQAKGEEPSDDVLLSHVPLPKAKIAVRMHDDEEPPSGHPGSHNYPGEHSEQDHAGNAGPMYQMVSQEDHNSAPKENLVPARGQPVEIEFQPHFAKHAPTHHIHQIPPPTRVAEIRTASAPNQRAPRQFTIQASPLQIPSQDFRQPRRIQVKAIERQEQNRAITSHFAPPRVLGLPRHYEGVLPTPPALRSTFQKATLHHEPHPKPFFMPFMFPSINNEPRDGRIFHLPQTKSFAQTTFPYLDSRGSTGGLGRLPLSRDIQAFIKKKRAAA